MKKIFIAPVLLLSIASITQARPKPPRKELTVISDKKHVVYFKVNKSFIGGLVEVYDESQSCLEADSLPHTHTMVHFNEMPAGHYTVKVKKGNKLAEFSYNNN
ncbi:MAG TPA: hypothetical protein VGQ59_07610 [Cyclobacteriaceae bacterium]|jgi:hypothetical protein|nr:hypothetical protein [Cyclobacteriaceae bacterium]